MKNLIKFSIFSLIVCIILVLLDLFVFVDIATSPYKSFYAQKQNSLDFVAIGNSTVREGISPLEAWHNYGLTGSNICDTPTHPEVIVIAIDEILRLQSPKVIYIDLNGLTYQKFDQQESFVKEYVEAMPDSKAKDALIAKYDYLQPTTTSIELFNFHNNFRNPDSFLAIGRYSKGFLPHLIARVQDDTVKDEGLVMDLPLDGTNYLTRILEVCDKYPDVHFLFGKMPRFNDEATIKENYMLRSIIPTIEEHGHTYIEWDNYKDDIGLDPITDYYDVNHMNLKGAIKFSNYFAKYLCDNFDMQTQHSKNVVKDFNTCYSHYSEYVQKHIK